MPGTYWQQEAGRLAKQAEEAQARVAQKVWRQEAKEHFRKGTAKAHRITKPMEATTLRLARRKDGSILLAVDGVLEFEAETWSKWWGRIWAHPASQETTSVNRCGSGSR